MQKAIILILLIVIAVMGYFLFVQNQKLQQEVPVITDTVEVEATGKKGKGKRKFVNLHIDSIAIHKGTRQLFVFSKEQLMKTYNVALGVNPVGKKEVEGDNKTPEGLYNINRKNPFSTYHKSLGISYPNAEDKEHARELGQNPGGDIMIHGLMKHMNNPGKLHIKSNWTAGCIAVTDEEIDELFQQIKVGTPVFIEP
jgi:murein L,D-transpeptidase YafK